MPSKKNSRNVTLQRGEYQGGSDIKESLTEHFLSPNFGRIVALALEEIIGRPDLEALLKLASLPKCAHLITPAQGEPSLSFNQFSRLHAALEEMFGSRGAGGIALRAGRASFKHVLRQFSTELGITDLSFRLLPLAAKLETGTQALADLFNHSGEKQVRVEMDDRYLYWHIAGCPLCWQRKAPAPTCHSAVGFLQAALYWVSSGKTYTISETHCIACGDEACTILIERKPLE
jgi:predicted hydrocarbon binding protein